MAPRVHDTKPSIFEKSIKKFPHSFKSFSVPNFVPRFRLRVPRLTFLRLHWTYFVTTCLLCSVILWASANPRGSISYTDSLFLVVAAMSLTGMNSVNLSSLNTFQQVMLCGLMIFGSQIFVSFVVVHFRKQAFKAQFQKLAEEQKKRQQNAHLFSVCTLYSTPPITGRSRTLHRANDSSHIWHLRVAEQRNEEMREQRYNDPLQTPISDSGHNTLVAAESTPRAEWNLSDAQIPCCNEEHRGLGMDGTSDRHAQFHGLSRQEREHLGCIEYQALRLLSYLVPAYYILWQFFGCIGLGAYISYKKSGAAGTNAVNPWWAGGFYSVSAVNNVGMSLLDLSLVPFQSSIYMLTTISLLMLAGNTAYPIFLRLILWTSLHILPDKLPYQPWRSTIHFILKYPRRVYTNLFPSPQTWWLLFTLLLFNSIDWATFELLNRHNPSVTSIPDPYRLLDGLVQAIALRTTGFTVIPLSDLAIGVRALYMMMMYISAFPVVMAMRNSNVYEERSLGIYAEDKPPKDDGESALLSSTYPLQPRSRAYFLKEQVGRQLGHDLWFISICIIIITIIETAQFNADPVNFSVFNIIFEVFAAYSCVGLSIGLPDQAYSFSGVWGKGAKLILCAVMLKGRHRGLPVNIDRAVMLPGLGEVTPREEEGRNWGGGHRRNYSGRATV